MSLAILFHFLCAQHVSDINISIIRSLRLCCWITTSVVLFSVRCVLEIWCGLVWVVSVLQAETDTTQTQPHQISYTHRTENKTTDVVIQQHCRKLLMMDILNVRYHEWVLVYCRVEMSGNKWAYTLTVSHIFEEYWPHLHYCKTQIPQVVVGTCVQHRVSEIDRSIGMIWKQKIWHILFLK